MNLTSCFLALALIGSTSLPGPHQTQQPAAPTSTDEDFVFRLGPADSIQVWLWQEPDLGAAATVRPDGRITLPLINEIEASGKTPAELQQELTEEYKTYLGDPIVSVIVTQIGSLNINILGEVQSEGRYSMVQPLTIIDAISMAGGLSDFTDGKEVFVLRPGPQGIERIQVNFRELLEDGDGTNVVIRPSDTIYVK
jgi:polysaccharide export outer membrane protein